MSEPTPSPFQSLPALFLHTCNTPGFTGWNHRVNGAWLHYSGDVLKQSLLHASLALRELGFIEGCGLGIIAPSSPRWILLDLAAQVCGGYTVPLFPNISSDNFSYQISDAPVHFLAVHDLNELDPLLRSKVCDFPKLLRMTADPSRSNPAGKDWDSLMALGESLANETSELWFRQRLESLAMDQVFSIIYTSGSTGVPKGVPLTHRNMLVQVEAICSFFPLDAHTDAALSILPVAHVFERMAVYYFLRSGIQVWFADDPKNAGVLLPEIRPSVLTVVPRILEKLYEKLAGAPAKTRGPKKWLLQWAIQVARSTDPLKPSWRRLLLEPLVYRKMREALGNRFKVIVSGSSALNPSVARFLLNIGLPVFEGYGLTECSPVVSACHPGCQQPGSVGPPLPHLEVRISEEGEVQVRGPSVFQGYHRRPDLNADICTADGFFRTGDKGILDPKGNLVLKGRLKEMHKTSTGKYVSPVPIELHLVRNPLIDAAQVFADNRKFPTALLFLGHAAAAQLLGKTGTEFDPARAITSRRVNARIAHHIKKMNRTLNEWERIGKWALVADEPSVENGLLTPTLKLRRQEVDNRYAPLIETLYPQADPM